jgi:hypothetical protein
MSNALYVAVSVPRALLAFLRHSAQPREFIDILLPELQFESWSIIEVSLHQG